MIPLLRTSFWGGFSVTAESSIKRGFMSVLLGRLVSIMVRPGASRISIQRFSHLNVELSPAEAKCPHTINQRCVVEGVGGSKAMTGAALSVLRTRV